MGMFDRVWINCPKCMTSHELHSKRGSCHLQNYSAVSVPFEIASDLEGQTFMCTNCKTYNTISVYNPEIPKTVHLIAVPA